LPFSTNGIARRFSHSATDERDHDAEQQADDDAEQQRVVEPAFRGARRR
jgi:hypothetical protein